MLFESGTRVGIVAFVCAGALLVSSAGAETATAEQWATVLNLAGRQRMLTQKMSKEFLFVAADVDATANRKNLGATMSLFETTLRGLRDGDSELNLPATGNPRIVKQIDKVAALWAAIKPHLAGVADGKAASQADLAAVAEKNIPLLTNMNKVVKQYEREAKGTLGGDQALAVVINLAGRQRMLTQKMSKEFLLVHLGISTAGNRLNTRESVALFDRTLNGLISGDQDLELPAATEPEIRAQLQKVDGLWEEFMPTVAKAGNTSEVLDSTDLQAVAEQNLPLLKNMNAAVKQFERLAASAPASSTPAP